MYLINNKHYSSSPLKEGSKEGSGGNWLLLGGSREMEIRGEGWLFGRLVGVGDFAGGS